MTTRLADVIVPEVFTNYVVENSVVKSNLVQSGLVASNAAMAEQLRAGADSFSVPFWRDLGDDAANLANDDPSSIAAPRKLTAGKQIVRKSFLHGSWGAMNLASELAGDDALARIQSRVAAYWTREAQRRLVATLGGILAENIANGDGDMLNDSGSAFNAAGVIDTAGTLGDSLRDVVAVAMHSKVYTLALKNDLIQTIPDSQGGFIQTFRGLGILVDDGMPVENIAQDPETDPAVWAYTTVLFGAGAIGYALTAPRIAQGTEIENIPASGNGGGQQILHSRVNLAIHPLGYQWKESSVAADSPSTEELAMAGNWTRVAGDRKHVPIAFYRHTLA